MHTEVSWKEFVLWFVGILVVPATVVGFMLLAFKESDANREKEVVLMETCTETGGTWLGNISTCVQPGRELQ